MAIGWALLTAFGFGVGDFLAGLASRRLSALWVAALSSLATGALLLGVVVLVGGALDDEALIWGTATGLALAAGLLAYYLGFARGGLGLVAAITGVWSAVVPLVVGLGLGERPGGLALAGVVLLIAAIALVSGGQREPSPLAADQRPSSPSLHLPLHGVVRDPGVGRGPVRRASRRLPPGFCEATLAGVGFGLVFVFLGQAQTGHPLWPVVVSIVVAGGVLGAVAVWRRPPLRLDGGLLTLIVAAGLFQAGATVAFVLAAREGFLSIVAVAGAMSPIPTAICAWLILRERLSRQQGAGFAAAMLGIAAIVLG